METVTFRAKLREDGARLIDALAAHLNVSRSRAKACLDRRQVFVNGKRVWMAHHALHAGDEIVVHQPRPAAVPAADAEDVLFRDDDLLIVNKPAGVNTTGPSSIEAELQRRASNPGLSACHRLDRETSGCLLFALNRRARDMVVKLFAEECVRKQYYAIAMGRPRGTEFVVSMPLDNERAVTHVRVLDASETASLLSVSPETGRTHQIRRHLSAIGCPIAGDKQYGVASRLTRDFQAIGRHMLHASGLSFPHPDGASRIQVYAPVPRDFGECAARFGLRMPRGTRSPARHRRLAGA